MKTNLIQKNDRSNKSEIISGKGAERLSNLMMFSICLTQSLFLIGFSEAKASSTPAENYFSKSSYALPQTNSTELVLYDLSSSSKEGAEAPEKAQSSSALTHLRVDKVQFIFPRVWSRVQQVLQNSKDVSFARHLKLLSQSLPIYYFDLDSKKTLSLGSSQGKLVGQFAPNYGIAFYQDFENLQTDSQVGAIVRQLIIHSLRGSKTEVPSGDLERATQAIVYGLEVPPSIVQIAANVPVNNDQIFLDFSRQVDLCRRNAQCHGAWENLTEVYKSIY